MTSCLVRVRVGAAARAEARTLLAALTAFPTASDALARLLGGLEAVSAPAERFSVAAQVLYWQNLPADGADALDAALRAAEGDEAEGEAEAETGAEVEVEVARGMVLTAMGKPALLFAASLYDDELSALVWSGLLALRRHFGPALDLARQALDSAGDAHGLSALHYALEAQMHALALRIWRDVVASMVGRDQGEQGEQVDGSDHDARAQDAEARAARLMARVVSRDVALPASRRQLQGRSVTSGGASLLHFSARLDAPPALVRALLAGAPPALAAAPDWDGNSPYRVALLHGHRALAGLLREHSNERAVDREDAPETVAELRAAREERARARVVASLEPSAALPAPRVFPALWTRGECARVLRAVERAAARAGGWETQRHASYPTTDLPSHRVAPLDGWVRASLAARLLPRVAAHVALPDTRALSFRELFFVKYEARGGVGARAELPLHRDGSELSFNVLLNSESDFSGGGTFFEASGETICPTQGDAVVHSGKVRHAGAPVLSGRRMLLVGFLDAVDRVDWP